MSQLLQFDNVQTDCEGSYPNHRERERFPLKRAGKWQRGVSKSQKREVLSFSEPKQINKQTSKQPKVQDTLTFIIH